MNLKVAFDRGQEGKNMGLPTGMDVMDEAIDGIQKASIYGFAAGPKVGKTKIVDSMFVLAPYILAPEKKKKWFYFSFEITRIQKEFNFAAYFMSTEYDIKTFIYEGREYEMSSRYLQGRLTYKDELGEKYQVPVSDLHKQYFDKIYQERLIPLFGEYDERGHKIKEGLIEFIEAKDNPTGMRNLILSYCETHGEFVYEKYTIVVDGKQEERQRLTGWVPNDPDETLMVITDHMRKLRRERGYSMKENIDKWIEYQVELRNLCGCTFIDIIHLNRSISNIDRLTFQPEFLHPTGDDIKDTGNLSEEVDYMFTLFNPTDEKYNIKKHFGKQIIDGSGNEIYSNYRSLHLVESRTTESPMHFFLEMNGATNEFRPITETELIVR